MEAREGLKFIVEGNGGSCLAVVDGIRRYYHVTEGEAKDGYGRIIALEPGRPPFILCSFLLDMDPDDILTLFWVKLKENFPDAAQPRTTRLS